MKTLKISLLFIGFLTLITSCVPARKYEELKSKQQDCASKLEELKSSSEGCLTRKTEIEEELKETKRVATVLARDTTLLGASYRQMKVQYDKINELNDQIMKKLEYLQNSAANESKDLNSALQQTKIDLQRKEDELRLLETNLRKLESDLKSKESLLVEREKRLKELEEIIASKDAAVKALKDKIANALLSFQDKGLTVTQKNGKVYVSMEAKLLFASGSIKVDPKGKEALIKLAKALEGQQDLEIVVEGHTDTDKMSSSSHPKDNWELSVLRATSVVKIITANSTIDPKTLSASGKSEYVPVDPEDKSKNRRIEVILTPNLDELYKVLEGN